MADRVSGHGLKYDVHVGVRRCGAGENLRIKIDLDARTDWRASATTDGPIPSAQGRGRRAPEGRSAQHWRLMRPLLSELRR